MSLDATKWAWKAPVSSAAERLVLLAYGDAASRGDRPTAWLGLERLHAHTNLDPKTITAARRELQRRGYLVDTGKRKGFSGRVTVFELDLANTTGNGAIRAVDKPPETREIRMDSEPETPPISEPDTTKNGETDCTENGDGIYSLNHPRNRSAPGAEEPDPGRESADTPEPTRIEGFEHPIVKLRQQYPHMFNGGAKPPPAEPEETLDS